MTTRSLAVDKSVATKIRFRTGILHPLCRRGSRRLACRACDCPITPLGCAYRIRQERVDEPRQIRPVRELVITARVRGSSLAIGDVLHRPSLQEVIGRIAEGARDM